VTLDDKRKVIEVLLCCAQNPWTHAIREHTGGTARALEVSGRVDLASNWQWMETRREFPFADRGWTHGDVCITAAYRLIESSPTLRREWFGAR
jgi:hypothetical protein